MQIFTSICATVSTELIDLLKRNNSSIESKYLQDLCCKSDLTLLNRGDEFEFVGSLQSLVCAYNVLVEILKAKYKIVIDELDTTKTFVCDDFEFEEIGNSENLQSDLLSDEHVINHLQDDEKVKRDVPDPIVLSFKLKEFENQNSEKNVQAAFTTDIDKPGKESIMGVLESSDKCQNNSEVERSSSPGLVDKVDVDDIRQQEENQTDIQENKDSKQKFSTQKLRRKSQRNKMCKNKESLRNPNHQENYFNDNYITSSMSQVNECESDSGVCHSNDERTDQKEELEVHLDSRSTKNVCLKCDYVAKNSKDLRLHTKNKHSLSVKNKNSNKKIESTCKNDKIRGANVEKKLGLKPVDPKAKNIPCQINNCSFIAKEKKNMIEHLTRTHLKKTLKCKHCNMKFSIKKDFIRHLKVHQEPQNCCEYCGKMYKSARTCLEHQKSHKEDYVKPEFTCKTCGKSFSTKYVLKYHVKSEHLGIRKTYLCPTCGKSFTQKQSYLMHANVHLGLRPFVCEVCGMAFPYEKSLKEHKYMHDEVKRFKCEVCNKDFRQPSALNTHMKIHQVTKDHLCGTCGKGFTQRQALHRHERIHSGDKPFICKQCGRTFSDASIIRRHIIMVHKKNPNDWRSEVKSEASKQSDFFIQVISGEKQPQLKQKGRPPKKYSSSELSTDSEQCPTEEIDKASESRANAALALSSMASVTYSDLQSGSDFSKTDNSAIVIETPFLEKQSDMVTFQQNVMPQISNHQHFSLNYVEVQEHMNQIQNLVQGPRPASEMTYQTFNTGQDNESVQKSSGISLENQQFQDPQSAIERTETWTPGSLQYLYLSSNYNQYPTN